MTPEVTNKDGIPHQHSHNNAVQTNETTQTRIPETGSGNTENKTKTSRWSMPSWSRIGEIAKKVGLVVGAMICGAAALYLAIPTLVGGFFMLLAVTQAKNHETDRNTTTLNKPGLAFAIVGSALALPLAGCVACVFVLAGKKIALRQ